MLVPMLDELIRDAAETGAKEVLIGMAHRGRLNVLAHVLGKPYAAILSEFHLAPNKDLVPSEGSMGINYGWTGDVKYHLGARRTLREGVPAHDPAHDGAQSQPPGVRQPRRRGLHPRGAGQARRARRASTEPRRRLAIVIHGDAAFPGEGVVAETLNLSRLPGYQTGGTIHIIANNQVGFTTEPNEARSTLYASDLAKGFEIPIMHVNADDPDACLAAVRLARDVPAALPPRLPDRPDRLPALGPQRGRRASLHPAAALRAHRRASDRPRALRRRAGRGGRHQRRRGRARCCARLRTQAAPGGGGGQDWTLPAGAGRAARVLAALVLPNGRGRRDTARAERGAAGASRRLHAERQARAAAATARRRAGPRERHRLGARRVAGLRRDPRRGHPDPPERAGHRARHLQPAPPRPARRARPARATSRSRRSRRRARPSPSTTARSRRPPSSASSTATASTRRARSCCGRRSSATSPTPGR